jgi:transcriptional regulator with XRE-family HTH domain
MTPLKAARLAKGWKAARLARELGVSETTLSRWENDHSQRPRRCHQIQLCRILDKDPTELGFAADLLDLDRRKFTTKVLGVLGTTAVGPLLATAGEESLQLRGFQSLVAASEGQAQKALVLARSAVGHRVARFRPELARWNGTQALTALDDQLADAL